MKYILIILLIGIFHQASVQAKSFATQMVEATFKLYHKDSTATCFLIKADAKDKDPGELYLVTAAHVLERTKGDTAVLVLRKHLDDGSFKRHDHKIQIRHNDKPLWLRHEINDLAILKLKEPLPIPAHALPYSAIADETSLTVAKLDLCSSIFLLTYPERFEANKVGFPVARQGIISSYPFLPIKKHATYLADFTTFAGDSGGPVFIAGKDGKPLIIGVVLAKSHHEEKVTTRNENRVIHHSLGIGTILHAQFIKDLIQKSSGKSDEKDKNKP